MRPNPPFPSHPEYMNGRLKKVDMTARLNCIKNGLANKSWYPEWDERQRGAAQRILNNALDVLDEYDY
tara:strand:+ start:85 stop:288 length:204 start_codon:yes stop_codon:yes gene_type:complete